VFLGFTGILLRVVSDLVRVRGFLNRRNSKDPKAYVPINSNVCTCPWGVATRRCAVGVSPIALVHCQKCHMSPAQLCKLIQQMYVSSMHIFRMHILIYHHPPVSRVVRAFTLIPCEGRPIGPEVHVLKRGGKQNMRRTAYWVHPTALRGYPTTLHTHQHKAIEDKRS
jgi:hypothetical protein